jgi:hypothetical protein
VKGADVTEVLKMTNMRWYKFDVRGEMTAAHWQSLVKRCKGVRGGGGGRRRAPGER